MKCIYRIHVPILALCASALVCSSSAFGQTELINWGFFIRSFPGSVPDQDGDGWRDLILGQPDFPNVGRPRGRVAALSSKTGAVIWQRRGVDPDGLLGGSATVFGDANGDGVPDVVAADRYNSTHILDGSDGSTLGVIPIVVLHYEPLGDLNSDGLADFLAGTTVYFELPIKTTGH